MSRPHGDLTAWRRRIEPGPEIARQLVRLAEDEAWVRGQNRRGGTRGRLGSPPRARRGGGLGGGGRAAGGGTGDGSRKFCPMVRGQGTPLPWLGVSLAGTRRPSRMPRQRGNRTPSGAHWRLVTFSWLSRRLLLPSLPSTSAGLWTGTDAGATSFPQPRLLPGLPHLHGPRNPCGSPTEAPSGLLDVSLARRNVQSSPSTSRRKVVRQQR